MKKIVIMAGVALALTASLAAAQTGINLSWNDCGVNGTSSQTFTCASTSGLPFVLVASFVPPDLPEFLGIASQVDITTNSASLPLWWQHGTAFCRSTSGLAVNFDFTSGPFTCVDFFAGQAAGGFAYDVGFGAPNRARLRIQAAIPVDNRAPVSSSQEYYAYKVNLLRAKSTGTGSCAGCLDQACIVMNDIQLFQPLDQANDPILTAPLSQNFVTWQAASVPGCPLSTPAQKSSWGQVKSLYR